MTKKQAQAWQQKYGLDSTTSHKITGNKYQEDDPRWNSRTMGNRSRKRRKARPRPLMYRQIDTFEH